MRRYFAFISVKTQYLREPYSGAFFYWSVPIAGKYFDAKKRVSRSSIIDSQMDINCASRTCTITLCSSWYFIDEVPVEATAYVTEGRLCLLATLRNHFAIDVSRSIF